MKLEATLDVSTMPRVRDLLGTINAGAIAFLRIPPTELWFCTRMCAERHKGPEDVFTVAIYIELANAATACIYETRDFSILDELGFVMVPEDCPT